MRYFGSLLLTLSFSVSLFGQGISKQVTNPYAAAFKEAYDSYPGIPKGVLEAVAFTNTRFTHITSLEETSCMGMPKTFGVFGLVEDGKGVFRNSLQTILSHSSFSEQEIKSDPRKHILAYAEAYSKIKVLEGTDEMIQKLERLTELPSTHDFAYNSYLYSVISFLNDANQAATFNFPVHQLDMEKIFGADNLKVLSAPKILLGKREVKTEDGTTFKSGNPEVQSPDYGPALWTPAATCNYSNGRSQAVSAVTIHFVQGSYAGCIGWFQNCAASVSAHYVVRSSDGQITQMVLESNTGWHVGNQNAYTVGIEHEGYVSQQSWYTNAMYTSSAALTADICASHGIDPLRTGWWPWLPTTYYNQSSIPGACTRVKGHMHYPSQSHTDPGPFWDWDYYYKLINPAPAANMLTAANGNFYDSGGPSGNYADDERTVWTIAPTNATTVSLSFTSFNTENTWDYLYIYDGNSVFAPLIGMYTGTNSPGTVSSTGGTMTLEFRSDCSSPDAGWNGTWSSNASAPPSNLTVAQAACPSLGVDLSWTNSGTGWYVDISPDPNFTVFYNRSVNNVTTVACPGSFCEYPSCATYLQFEPNTTYYWRVWDGNTQTNGTPFTTPYCTYSSTNCNGNVDDSGGPSTDYGGNEDYIYTIAPTNAANVTITFNTFDLETNFDSLYIHDGPNENAPLIGSWTGTNSPGVITSTGGTLSLHFVSDPLVNNPGFTASWSCTQLTTSVEELNEMNYSVFPNPFSNEFSVMGSEFPVQVNLFNLLGEQIINTELNHDNNRLQTENLKAGIYLLRLTYRGETRVFRLEKI